jgi:hypothetical protein
MNLTQDQLRLDRLEKECSASAAPALLAAALSVLATLFGLGAMLG